MYTQEHDNVCLSNKLAVVTAMNEALHAENIKKTSFDEFSKSWKQGKYV